MFSLKKKAIVIFSLLLLFSIGGSVALAAAQDTLYPLIALSSDELTFYAKENGDSYQANLTLVGLAAENGVAVRIIASDLYDNSSGKAISNLKISDEGFDLKQNDNKTITVILDPSVIKAGTYEGVLIITATNKTASAEILTENIKITAEIEGAPLWYKLDYIQVLFVVGAIIPIFLGLLLPDKATLRYYSKRFWLVVFAAISVSFWLGSIVSFSFSEPGTIINTVLVTPFLTYVVSFVKDKRTERLDEEKTSRTIRNAGLKEDIILINNLIGDMATHCASFSPNFYAKKMQRFHAQKEAIKLDFEPRLLYPETGLIERKVWIDSCRQGFVADIQTLHLEKYYDFVPLYNQFYTEAMKRAKKLDPKTPVSIEDTEFFKPFEAFRAKYSELQKVLFVYLTYILELYSKTTLTPLKTEYPRITRTLLYKLIEYKILIPWDFIYDNGKIEFKEFSKQKILEKMEEDESLKTNSLLSENNIIDSFKNKYKQKADWLKKFKENNSKLRVGTDEFEKGFNEWLANYFNEKNPTLKLDSPEFKNAFTDWKKKEIDDVIIIENWITTFFENRIEWWEFSADEIDRIVDYIYAKDRVPHFFRHEQDDFQKIYLELKQCIKALPKLTETNKEDKEIKEYKISLGNIYKESKKDEKSGEKKSTEPDPLRLVLDSAKENTRIKKKSKE